MMRIKLVFPSGLCRAPAMGPSGVEQNVTEKPETTAFQQDSSKPSVFIPILIEYDYNIYFISPNSNAANELRCLYTHYECVQY
jgi:hypothetical protein